MPNCHRMCPCVFSSIAPLCKFLRESFLHQQLSAVKMLHPRLARNLVLFTAGFLSVFRHAASDHVRIETSSGKTFDAICPAKHYVSSLKIERVVNAGTDSTDFRFIIECDGFFKNAKDDVGTESCQILLPIPVLFYELRWDDLERNCDCNEYLAGIRSEHFGEKWSGNVKGKERRIQLVCCRASNRRLNTAECGYSGQESLLAPWRTAELGTSRLGGKARQGVIQALSLLNGYANSRICDWAPNTGTRAGDFDKVNGCYEEVTCTRNTDEKRLCYNARTEPWGWTEQLMYSDGQYSKVAVYTKTGRYLKQEHLCRNGQRVIGFKKNKLEKNAKNPYADYHLTVECGSNGGAFPCYCYWLNHCPTADVNEFYGGKSETWYVAGLRSWWENGPKQRKVELLCCKASSLKIRECNVSSQISDSRNSFNVNMPPNKKTTFVSQDGAETLEVVRNVLVTNIYGIMGFKFETCTAELTYQWCQDDVDEPCWKCRRQSTESYIRRELPTPRPPPITGFRGLFTNGAWQSNQYASVDSSGWGPMWFNRPQIKRPAVTGPVMQAPPAAPTPPQWRQGYYGNGQYGNGYIGNGPYDPNVAQYPYNTWPNDFGGGGGA